MSKARVDHAVIEAELSAIAQKNGGHLTPEDVVAAATPHNSPLHDWFEWSDTEAARKYRIEQARQMIKVVNISITYAPNATVVVPVYVSESETVEDDNGDVTTTYSYAQVVEVISDNQRRRDLVIATCKRAVAILKNCPEPFCQKWAKKLEKEMVNL